MRLMRFRTFIARALLLISCVAQAHGAEVAPLIAAASDLRYAMDEIAAQFQRSTGRAVKLSYGSSGNYYSQIQQGAPFELFMSADESFVLKLHDAGKLQDKGKLYAIGRIVLYAPEGASWSVDPRLEGLRAALGDKRIQRFAIANPEHAPYGARAREALQHAGLWTNIQSKLVLGENISQTAQFATSGSTQGGIIALSLAKAPAMAALGDFALIPEDWHQPLRQRMVLVKDAPPAARAFYDYLASAPAQEIMVRYGFAMPKER